MIYDHDTRDDPEMVGHMLSEWIHAIRSGNIIDDTKIGATSTLTAIMGRLATYTGQRVTWEQAMNANQLVPDPIDWDTPPPVLPDENGFYPVPVPGITELIDFI